MDKTLRTTAERSYSSRSYTGPVVTTIKSNYSVRSSYGGTRGAVRMVGGQLVNSGVYGGSLDYLYKTEMGSGMGVGRAMSFPVTAVTVNKSLLTPLNLEIDPDFQAIRLHEKEQIKILNNKFAFLIDKKVRLLEQENERLETKWRILQEQSAPHSKINNMFENHIAELRRDLDDEGRRKRYLESELSNMRALVEDFKNKFEDEINKRPEVENTFVLLKKDADHAFKNMTELEASRKNVDNEIVFLTRIHDQKLMELKSLIGDKSVVVEMDNRRNLDMDDFVAEVRAYYEEIAKRNQAEAESFYKHKYEELQVTATQHGDNLKTTRAEITEFNRHIRRLQSDLNIAKNQRISHDLQVKEAEELGEKQVNDARLNIQELEEALQRAKHDMARQVREYQSLMSFKLALDIEIATYKKLLEGEESRLVHGVQSIKTSKQSHVTYPPNQLDTMFITPTISQVTNVSSETSIVHT